MRVFPEVAENAKARAGGDTPLLVLMPGLDGTGLLFEPFLAQLPPCIRTRVVAYPNEGAPSLAQHAAAVHEAIAAEGRRVILLAESFSGLVAMQLLGEAPEKISKVIFAASFVDSPRRYLRYAATGLPVLARGIRYVPNALLRHYCLGAQASRADIRWLRNTLERVDPDVIAHRLKMIASARVTRDSLTVPAFYLQASGDRLVPARAAARVGELFADFSVQSLTGPHFLLQAHPRESARAVARIIG